MTPVAGSAAARPVGHVSLAQIVAALSVTYKPEGVLIWLTAKNAALPHSDGRIVFSPYDFIADGRIAEVADLVRAVGDADPADFEIVDRSVS